MCAENKHSHTGLLKSVLTNKCPRCREGNLFLTSNAYALTSFMHMPEHCPVCGQKFELQTGFYFGTGYVSYGITVFLSAVTFVLWWFTIGISIRDNSVIWWLVANAALLLVLQPPLQRLSRSVWVAFFVRYNPEWRAVA